MATYNFDQYKQVLLGRLNQLYQNFYPLQIAVSNLKADQAVRIWDESKNSAGQDLKSFGYDTTPAYIAPDKLPRKAGSNVGKRDLPIKTLYFPGGYAEMKRAVGRPPVELFGLLRNDFVNTNVTGQGMKVQISVSSQENAGKAEGVQKKYGKLFLPTEDEMDTLKVILKDEIIKAING